MPPEALAAFAHANVLPPELLAAQWRRLGRSMDAELLLRLWSHEQFGHKP